MVCLLFDYCLLRDRFGTASVTERRASEARPKNSRSSHDLNNAKTRRTTEYLRFLQARAFKKMEKINFT